MNIQEPQNLPNQKSFLSGFASTALLIWDFLKIIIVALVIIIPIRYFIFQPFIVSGSSMEPNFYNGEYLVIDEISYQFGSPKRGDVVVLRYPKDPDQYFIKRVIGIPGEKIEIENGSVKIMNDQHPSGFELKEEYLPVENITYPHDPNIVGGKKVLSLGENEYFVMGDNRLASSDSRDWGVLKRDQMIGKVFLRALPLSDFQVYTKTPGYGL